MLCQLGTVEPRTHNMVEKPGRRFSLRLRVGIPDAATVGQGQIQRSADCQRIAEIGLCASAHISLHGCYRQRGSSAFAEWIGTAEAGTEYGATCVPTRIRKARRSHMPGISGMTGGSPGFEARTSLSTARRRARVHRLQYFCRRRVRPSRVKGRLGRVFQAELDHFRHALAAQLRDKGQNEIDACRDAAPGQDIAVPYDAAIVDNGAEDREQFPPRPSRRVMK